MALGHHKRAIGTFSSYRDAETAVRELKDSGFPMDRVSVVGRDSDRAADIADAGDLGDRNLGDKSKQVAHDTKADEGAKKGAATGGALGGLTGLLVGLGALAIPGIGPVMLAGTLATALATAVSGGAIGAAAGGLVGGLVGLGIPEDRARVYNDRVSRGDYMVIVDGSEDEIQRAATILSHRGIQEWGVYDSTATDVDRAEYPTGSGAAYTTGETPRRDPLL